MKKTFTFILMSFLAAMYGFAAESDHSDHSDFTAELSDEFVKSVEGVLSTGKYYLAADVSLSDYNITITDDADVTICLNGYKLAGNGSGSVIKVSNRADLTLCDCQNESDADEHRHAYYIDAANDSVYVFDNGQEGWQTVYDGLASDMKGEITGGVVTGGVSDGQNGNSRNGGAVDIFDSATLTMSDVTLAGNRAVEGGAVFLENGAAVFTMNSGSLQGNAAQNGGGVHKGAYSTFFMYDGLIAHNHVSNNGGGVAIADGYNDKLDRHFRMYAGQITDNVAAQNGGGVYIGSWSGTFHFYDGLIARNYANIGGGVYGAIGGGSNFYMYGGTITQNDARDIAGAAYLCGANLSGGMIAGNGHEGEQYSIHIGTGNFTGTRIVAERGIRMESWGTTVTINGSEVTGDIFGDGTFQIDSGFYDGVVTCGYNKINGGQLSATAYESLKDKIADNQQFVMSMPETSEYPYTVVSTAAHEHADGKQFANMLLTEGGNITGGNSEAEAVRYYLACDVTLTNNIVIDGYVELCLNGHTLTGSGDGSVITVNSGGHFRLCDCSAENTGTVTGGNSSTFGGAVLVSDNAVFVMDNGNITANKSVNDGGGVYVVGDFTMNGGSITGNTATYGGGVYVSGSFEMNGGKISGNVAGDNGEDLYLYGPDSGFEMHGGEISGYTSDDGGIYNRSGRIAIDGGYLGNSIGMAENASVSLAGGYLSQEAYDYVKDYVDGSFTLVDISSDWHYGDADYREGYQYAVYAIGQLPAYAVTAEPVVYGETVSPQIENNDFNVAVTYSYQVGETIYQGLPAEVGEYTVTALFAQYIDGANKTYYPEAGIPFYVNIGKAESAISVGDNYDVTYGELLEISGSVSEGFGGYVVLSWRETELARADVSEDGNFNLEYDTSLQGLPVGDNVAKIYFSGNASYLEGSVAVALSLAQKSIDTKVSGEISKVYDGSAEIDLVLEIDPSGLVNADDEITATAKGTFQSANAGNDILVTVHDVQVAGTEAGFYSLIYDDSAYGDIIPAPLGMPADIQWVPDHDLGWVDWSAVENADGYMLRLYKDGEVVSELQSYQSTSFLVTMQEAGEFKMGLTAIGSGNYANSQEAFSDTYTYYAVSFNTGTTEQIPDQIVFEGGVVDEPEEPVRTDYEFGGWYADEDLTTEWNFASDVVTGSIVLYAKWIPVPPLAVSETTDDDVIVTASDGRIYCNIEDYKIFDLSGQDVSSQNGNLAGIYIVKVEDKAVKVRVR